MYPKKVQCDATGKRCYATKGEAKEAIIRFKSFGKYTTGKRIKHRMKKPAQKRTYLCPDCNFWHLSSQDTGPFNKRSQEVSDRQTNYLKEQKKKYLKEKYEYKKSLQEKRKKDKGDQEDN